MIVGKCIISNSANLCSHFPSIFPHFCTSGGRLARVYTYWWNAHDGKWDYFQLKEQKLKQLQQALAVCTGCVLSVQNTLVLTQLSWNLNTIICIMSIESIIVYFSAYDIITLCIRAWDKNSSFLSCERTKSRFDCIIVGNGPWFLIFCILSLCYHFPKWKNHPG